MTSPHTTVRVPAAAVTVASLALCLTTGPEAAKVPATAWPVLVAMVASVAVTTVAVGGLGHGWRGLRAVLVAMTVVAAA